MSFMDAVKSCFTQYVGFSGRARRSEYWFFFLFELIVSAVLGTLFQVTQMTLFSVIDGIFGLACLLPGLAVCIRRMHDIGKSGCFILICLFPCFGTILFIIWCCMDS
ncbi:MAG: DUF805 domain-containing protein, partial [Lachnospiraceae bacterium]|nr:DUF805 domain-containing protein [Lachnospiraceae bacterium]